MSHFTVTATKPQLALQSYLDALLQDAACALEQQHNSALAEFEAAVLEEQLRDAQARQVIEAVPAVVVRPQGSGTLPDLVAETVLRPPQPSQAIGNGRPDWAQASFECLLFDVAGLTLAVPLVCLGSIYSLAGQELTALFAQPPWFLGLLPSASGNLKVLDTARWVMPERYREDFRQGLQYVISVQGYDWALAVHQVNRSIRLHPDEIKWRSERTQRPWLAGTVIEHMCALLDVAALVELLTSGTAKAIGDKPLH
jgi:purine-binding chemotaxis protein CheW